MLATSVSRRVEWFKLACLNRRSFLVIAANVPEKKVLKIVKFVGVFSSMVLRH